MRNHALVALLLVRASHGALLAKIFTDHAVLQRAPASANVYGFVAPGASVDVHFNGATLSARADATGAWLVTLPPTPAGDSYTIAANTTDAAFPPQTITDVLFGEVVLCGGQSNVRRAAPRCRALRAPLTSPPRPNADGHACFLRLQ